MMRRRKMWRREWTEKRGRGMMRGKEAMRTTVLGN